MTPLSFVRTTLLAGAIALAVPVFAAAPDASMHEVYLAAEAGKFAEAQAMMDQVLKDHPNSAKAHFVEAELLAKQGKFPAADAELKTAERLAPGLPFAKAGAVEKLRTLLASGHAAPRSNSNANLSQQPPPVSYNSGAVNNGGNVSHSSGGGTPWGLLLVLGLVLAAFIVMASRFMARRSAQTQAYGPTGGVSGYSPAGFPPQPGYGPAQGYGPAAPGGGGGMGLGGSGLGGSIVGGLATGAAVGAGIVAGEALMHRFTDSNRDQGNSSGNQRNDIVYDQPAGNDQLRADDMGGSDFGVNDSSSWDDSSGGGGGGGGGDTDDWN